MKRILLFSFVFILVGQAGDIKNEENRMITLDNVKVKYINFIPENIDKTCLDRKIETLFIVLLSEKKAKEMEKKIPLKEYFSKKYEKQRKEIKELLGQLLQQKHVSSKGNHEWRKLIDSKYILIEDKERKIYIMYPLEPSYFIMSGIPFKTLDEGQGIVKLSMKNWIDIRECFESSQE